MLTDEQLNPMTRAAPLLVNEYRKLRERMQLCEKMMVAANVTLKDARFAVETAQANEKATGLKLVALIAAVNALGDPEGRLCGVHPGPEREMLEQLLIEIAL